jgi:hypothetical protein
MMTGTGPREEWARTATASLRRAPLVEHGIDRSTRHLYRAI